MWIILGTTGIKDGLLGLIDFKKWLKIRLLSKISPFGE